MARALPSLDALLALDVDEAAELLATHSRRSGELIDALWTSLEGVSATDERILALHHLQTALTLDPSLRLESLEAAPHWAYLKASSLRSASAEERLRALVVARNLYRVLEGRLRSSITSAFRVASITDPDARVREYALAFLADRPSGLSFVIKGASSAAAGSKHGALHNSRLKTTTSSVLIGALDGRSSEAGLKHHAGLQKAAAGPKSPSGGRSKFTKSTA